MDPFAPLAAQGLNLHAVFDLNTLPAEVLASLNLSGSDVGRFTQLILLGHAGRDFWGALKRRGLHGSDPVDTFVGECVQALMAGPLADHSWRQVFPGPQAVNLQKLGLLAGWHQRSPLGLGVDAEWGSWFAYRAVVLARTHLPATPKRALTSPCLTCVDQPCISACPAGALACDQPSPWRLQTCLTHRLQPASGCQDRCSARNACPVGEASRYSDEQVAYHCLHSLAAIRSLV
ncbi:MAG: hypothetical protein RI959_1717 [Pseudomonadota bacterium]|jgi:epoxyqueuosine reductase